MGTARVAALAGALAAVVVTAGPVGQAAAFTVAKPTGLPATMVLGSLDNATPLERSRAVGNALPADVRAGRVPQPGVGSTAGFGSKAGSAFMASATGLSIGWGIGSEVGALFGLDSQGALRELLGRPDPNYVPNVDLPPPDSGVYPAEGASSATYNGQFRSLGYETAADGSISLVVEVLSADGATGYSYDLWVHCSAGGWPAGYAAEVVAWQTTPQYGGPARVTLTVPTMEAQCGGPGTYDGLGVNNSRTVAPTAVRALEPVGEQDLDPERVFRTNWFCVHDGVPTAGSAESVVFRESQPDYPPFPEAVCGPGGLLDSMTIDEVTLDGSVPTHRIGEWARPAGVRQWQEQFPQCWTGGCITELHRIDPDTGARLSCHANPELCLDWFTNPDKATQYECSYGGAVVGLVECNAYSPTFNVATGTAVKTAAGPVPSTSVEPYADPKTGEPVPRPDGGTDPGTGTGTDPQPDTGCPPPFDYGLSLFKPWWYWKSLTCALSWAFVPVELGTQLGSLRDEFMGRPPGSVLAAAGDVAMGAADGWGSGCSVLPDFSPAQDGTLRLPCVPSDSPVWTTAYGLVQVGMIIGTGFMLWHMALAGLGARAAGGDDGPEQ
jgi:hypothetical protein